MTMSVEAIYENGVLKLAQSLPLAEHAKVRVTIEHAPSLAQRTAGMIGWTGDAETFERIMDEAEEPEQLP